MANHPLDKPAHPVETIPGSEAFVAPAAEPSLRLGPADHGRAMTLEQFRGAEEEEGYRYELGGGVLEVTEVPDDLHRQVVTNLYEAAARYRRDHPGHVLAYGGGSEFRLWIPGMTSGRNPDFGVVLRGTAPDHRRRRNPSLVAEVVSPRGEERDYQVKRQEYLAFGLAEYWIVDPQLRRVTVLTRRGDAWSEQVVRDEQLIPSLVLPGLATAVADLWTDLPDHPEPNNA